MHNTTNRVFSYKEIASNFFLGHSSYTPENTRSFPEVQRRGPGGKDIKASPDQFTNATYRLMGADVR